MKKLLIGTRYYDDSKNIYKVVRIKNRDTVRLQTFDGKETFTVKRDVLDSKYTKLTPNGYLIISVVDNRIPGEKELQKDVIVALYRTKQTNEEASKNLPYCVCRQNVVNIFYQMAYPNINMTHCGMSMSIDNCPPRIKYELLIACDSVSNNLAIAVYMDDDIDEILKMFNNTPYDIILKNGVQCNNMVTSGYVDSLSRLLKEERFDIDFYKAFNIETVDFDIKFDEDTLYLDRIQLQYFEDTFKYEMFDAFAVEFNYKIRLKDIKKNYFMVYSTTQKKLYIIVYTEGKYMNNELAMQIKNIKNQASIFNLTKYN